MIIGTFRNNGDGYIGCIHTLTLNAEVNVIRAEHTDDEDAPDWRVFLGPVEDGVEIGIGRSDLSLRGFIITLEIDDPALGAPLCATLLRQSRRGEPLRLRWSRPETPEQH